MSEYLSILKTQVNAKGQAAVARELGISAASVNQLLHGKYQADTSNMEFKIMGIYGNNGFVDCPMLGEITAAECAENFGFAKEYGNRATGNPDTLRLYLTCLKRCPIRNT